jgi:hypothetical protein
VLLEEREARRTVYYLPASAVATANAAGKAIRIPHGDMEVLLSPNALDSNYSNAMRSILNKIKTNRLEDYYVVINIDWGTGYRSAEVSLFAIGSRIPIQAWNDELLDSFSKRIYEELADERLLESIKNNVAHGVRPEILVRQMDRIQAIIRRELNRSAQKELWPMLKYTYPINRVEEPILIIAKNLGKQQDTSAFRREGGKWAAREVLNFGDDRAISETRPGAYEFRSERVNIPGNQNNRDNNNAIAAKYHLSDFFGRNGFYLDAPASRIGIAGTVARIAGAPRHAEPFSWLAENLGLNVSTYGGANPVTKAEAVRMIMSLYAYKTSTRPADTFIRNYESKTNAANAEINAAMELGIVPRDNFLPNQPLTIRELLEMLNVLDNFNII